MKASTLPDELCKNLSTDHWVSTKDEQYLLVVLDEVAVFNSTNAEELAGAFDKISCQRLKTANRLPFNGKENYLHQWHFKWTGLKHEPVKSADNLEASSMAKALMKVCGKRTWCTALIEKNNPRAEIDRSL